jgi:hypothetical protein
MYTDVSPSNKIRILKVILILKSEFETNSNLDKQNQNQNTHMKTKTIIKAINALPRGAALCEHFAYVFHQDDDPAQPAQLLVDILAWRTNSQRAEDEQFRDLSDLLHAIESLSGVASVKQVGDIDHEIGRGWTYQVTLV